jgi:hypothetical protein
MFQNSTKYKYGTFSGDADSCMMIPRWRIAHNFEYQDFICSNCGQTSWIESPKYKVSLIVFYALSLFPSTGKRKNYNEIKINKCLTDNSQNMQQQEYASINFRYITLNSDILYEVIMQLTWVVVYLTRNAKKYYAKCRVSSNCNGASCVPCTWSVDRRWP